MKYILVRYKNITLLVERGADCNLLLNHFSEIELLTEKVSNFYANLLTTSKKESDEIQSIRSNLLSKIGYRIIGVPFSNHDAELYALDKNLDHVILESSDPDQNEIIDNHKESQS